MFWPNNSLIIKNVLIMQTSSLKKYSVLGLVLLAASAVTAAFVPAKKSSNKLANCNGVLQETASDGDFNPDWTCNNVSGTPKNCISDEFIDTHAGQNVNTTVGGTTQDCVPVG
jgi:hypothetical protein